MRERLSPNRVRAGVTVAAVLATGALSLGGCASEQPNHHKALPTAAPSPTKRPITQHAACKAENPGSWEVPNLSSRAREQYARDLGVSAAQILFGATGQVLCDVPIKSKNMMDGMVTAEVSKFDKNIGTACIVTRIEDDTVRELSPTASPEDLFDFATPHATVVCPGVNYRQDEVFA